MVVSVLEHVWLWNECTSATWMQEIIETNVSVLGIDSIKTLSSGLLDSGSKIQSARAPHALETAKTTGKKRVESRYDFQMICHLHSVTECLHYVTVCKHSVTECK